jgi:hypothetical protein
MSWEGSNRSASPPNREKEMDMAQLNVLCQTRPLQEINQVYDFRFVLLPIGLLIFWDRLVIPFRLRWWNPKLIFLSPKLAPFTTVDDVGDKSETYNVTSGHDGVTITDVEKQNLLRNYKCITVAFFFIQHAMRECWIILSSTACPGLPYFSTSSHKRHDSRKILSIMFQQMHLYIMKH